MDSTAVRPIAVVEGAASPVIQALLRDFAYATAAGVRVAGIVEQNEADCPTRSKRSTLLSLNDGSTFPVYQDLGPGAAGCALDASGVVAASEAVRRDVAAGCELVVLSKFGKLEAEGGSGLVAAFAAAIEAGVPVVTSVAPRFRASWHAFAAPLYTLLPADRDALRQWWDAVQALHSRAA